MAERPGRDDGSRDRSADIARLRRWQEAGGSWRVVAESAAGVTVSLRTCSTDEEMDRIVSRDPEFVAYVDDRHESDDSAG